MALTYRRRFEGLCEVDSEVGCDAEVADLVETDPYSPLPCIEKDASSIPENDSTALSSGSCSEPGAADARPWTLPWYEDQLSPAPTTPPARNRTVIHQGVAYASLSEAACAALLELLVPGFRIQEGVTYQIPIGRSRTVDFFVAGVLFEYHPPRLVAERRGHGDFASARDYERFQQQYQKARYDKRKRETLLERTIKELGDTYYSRRRAQLDEYHGFRDTELVVATGIGELYERIVLRFGASVSPLSREQFTNLFFAFVKTIARQNTRRGTLPRRSSRARQLQGSRSRSFHGRRRARR